LEGEFQSSPETDFYINNVRLKKHTVISLYKIVNLRKERYNNCFYTVLLVMQVSGNSLLVWISFLKVVYSIEINVFGE